MTSSGVATCVGSVANGAPLDTGSPGEKTFTVNATDNAGNPASKSVSYSVADGTAPSITFTKPDRRRGVHARPEGGRGLQLRRRAERLRRGDL